MGQAIGAALPYLFAGASAYSAYRQHEAGRDAIKSAKYSARMQELETFEEARRLKKQQDANLATARARAAASGVGGGTVKGYLGEMDAEQKAQLEWLKKAGKSQADLTRMQGKQAARQATTGAFGSLIGAGRDYYTMFGK